MNYASIILALLKLANAVFAWAQDQKLIKAEDDRLIAAALIEMKNRSATLASIDARFAQMTEQDVTAELDKHGDFRD